MTNTNTNGDFSRLIAEHRAALPMSESLSSHAYVSEGMAPHAPLEVHGTTVIAMKFKGGVLNVGDRRATAANAIMYDRADKIIPLDDHTLVAIAGAYGRAIEVTRYLKHAFKYYLRSQLQPMSLDGKLQEISRALAGNLPNAMSGIGLFIPVLSAYDPDMDTGRIFFYDASGARFETQEFAAAGSGSERIRGVFEYLIKTKGPFSEQPLEEVLQDGLRLLEIAADLDSATGGYEKILPTARAVDAGGVREVSEETLRNLIKKMNQAK
ncbi:MAG: proteasome subunit alpha [Fimbriimonadia bacterium]|nr:proteasome subunit alpha [Fimbriimonadia bacterium]